MTERRRCIFIALNRIVGGLLVLIWLLSGMSGCGPKHYPKYTPSPDEIEWNAHHTAEREERFEEARAGYQEMCSREPAYIRACYDIARLDFDRGETAEGRRSAVDFIRRFPDDGLAPVAAKRIARSHIKSGELKTGIEVLEELRVAVSQSDVHDTVLYHLSILQGRAGRVDDEARTLEDLLRIYGRWDSQLWDDAIWRLIEIKRGQGDAKAEARLLERLLETRESSWVVGSYTSPYHDDALLRSGQLALERGDKKKAEKLFLELGDIETSRLRDESLISAAELFLERGQSKRACRLLGKIVREMPAASSVRRAKTLAAKANCR